MAEPGTSRSWLRWIFPISLCATFREHKINLIRSTVLVTCVTGLLEGTWFTDFSDALMLQTLQAFTPLRSELLLRADDPDCNPCQAAVFLIGQELFHQFGEQIPINRDGLATLLAEIRDEFPGIRVLVLDYDLSPTFVEKNGACEQRPLEGQGAIETELLQWTSMSAKSVPSVCPSDSVPNARSVVLVDPSMSGAVPCARARQQWRDDLVEKSNRSIRFAHAWIDQETTFPTVVRYRSKRADASSVDAPSGTCATPECSLASETAQATGCGKQRNGNAGAPMDKINFLKAEAALSPCEIPSIGSVGLCRELYPRAATAEVAFVGGSYTSADRFLTPLGSTAGVLVHAYTYASMHAPLQHRPWLSIAFDLLVGYLFGLAFHWVGSNFSRPGTSFAQRLTLIAINLGFILVAWLGCTLVALIGLLMNRWLNPLLVALGVGLDGFAATRAEGSLATPPASDSQGSPVVPAGRATASIWDLAGLYAYGRPIGDTQTLIRALGDGDADALASSIFRAWICLPLIVYTLIKVIYPTN